MATHRNVRKLGGETFYYFNHYKDKAAAQRRADYMRRMQGVKARVVKEDNQWTVFIK